jgi:transketolase
MMKNLNQKILKKYEALCSELRRDILCMHAHSGNSHVGSSLSVVEVLVALYFHTLNINSKNCRSKNRDRLIFSKGHAASSLYAILAKRGLFNKKVLKEYCVDEGRLPGHCTINSVSGVEASSGSLGHGLSMAAGLAIGARFDKNRSRAFAILSDGECQEGSVWEAAMFASQHKLDNLIAIVDYNKLQAFGRNEEIVSLEPFHKKWSAFGWSVKEVNGHSLAEIIKALGKVPFIKNKPSVIIAHTIKGKGVSFMEDKLLWHYKAPNKEELDKALSELV